MKRTRCILLATVGLWLAASLLAEEAPRALTLNESIRLALQKNPDLATAQQRLVAAHAAISQADASCYPKLGVSESYAASDNPVQAFMMTLNQRQFDFNANFNRPPVTDNFNTKVLATWSLYNGGRDLAGHQAAKLGAETVEQMREAVRNELVFEVTRAFHTVAKARQFVSTAEVSVKSMESNLKLAQDRFEQGATLKTDKLDAEVRLSEARENLVRARNALALSEIAFRNVLGVGEKEKVTAAEAPPLAETAAAAESADLLPDVSRRPELLAGQKAVAAAERQVRVAQGGYLPRVNAFASYDVNAPGSPDRSAESWLAGVSVEMDLFDGLLTRGKVVEARANLAAAREQLRRAELGLQMEARQAQLDLGEAKARLETTGRSVAQAEESVQLTRERYQNGLALLTQLLDAETALTAARQRRVAAEADRLIARAALDKALGKTWKE